MYEEFYGLRVKPFQMIPDPAFLYWSDAHLMTFDMLRYGVMSEAPLTVITGEVGAGKTTLLRQMLSEFPKDMVVGLVSNMQAGRGELLEWVLMAFDLDFEGGHVAKFKRFQDFVLKSYAEACKVVLIIDEAQNLGVEQLEELRMLSNINAEEDQLLQIILLGQPELRQMLARPELRQFSQRILADFHLKTLDAHEVRDYIQRRLTVAGTEAEIFPEHICNLIYQATDGVPRLINVLCDLCLVYGYAAERKVVDEELLRELTDSIEKNGIYNQMNAPKWHQPPKLVHEAGAVGPRMPAVKALDPKTPDSGEAKLKTPELNSPKVRSIRIDQRADAGKADATRMPPNTVPEPTSQPGSSVTTPEPTPVQETAKEVAPPKEPRSLDVLLQRLRR